MKPINKETVTELRNLIRCGLTNGLGKQRKGGMCIEAAVCFALGLPHGDDPPCVGGAVRSFKIRLNDSKWSSNISRAKGMERLGIAQLGSDSLNQVEFARKLAIKTVNIILPMIIKDKEIVAQCVAANDLASAQSATYAAAAAYAAADSAAYAAADSATYAAYAANAAHTAYAAAAYAAATYAANAAATYAATYAATAADYSAYADSAAAAAYAAYADSAADKILNASAQIALDILIEMKSPGCEYLYLCDE